MRIAVLGCGSIGRRHLKNLSALGQTDLLAFDPLPVACEAVIRELGIDCYTALDEVWTRNPNVVLVTSPTFLHLDLAIAAAKSDCHLFIEKPLSHSIDGVDELIAEVERRSLITMVGCNMRFHPGPAQVKHLIDKGAVGRTLAARIQTGSYLPRWRPHSDYRQSYSASQAHGGGAILDCIHEIDLALWYFGPGEVVGAASLPASSIELSVEGLAEILVSHKSGVLSSLHLNFVQRDYRRSCQIIGTQGSLYWDFEARGVRWYGADGQQRQHSEQPADWEINQMYLDELQYFLRCVEHRVTTFSTIDDGLAALNLALVARQLCDTG